MNQTRDVKNNNEVRLPDGFKALLRSWRLTELVLQLEDENIGLDELHMMKRHHLAELLCSHKMGTRIRFEYYFERWRRDQNKPLLGDANHQHCLSCPRPLTQTIQPSLPFAPPILNDVAPQQTIVIHKQQQSRATNTVMVRYANASTNTGDMMIKRQTGDDDATSPPPLTKTKTTTTKTSTPTPKSPLMQPAQQILHATQPTAHTSQLPPQRFQTTQQYQPTLSPSMLPPIHQDVSALHELAKLVRQPSLLEENTNMSANESLSTANNTCPASDRPVRIPFPNLNLTEGEPSDYGPLMHIINSSGFKGQKLLDYYQHHRQLTNAHRNVLIQLIVNFFEMNGYHLSLKVSHNLEQQILKLFPSEELQYYRNEKRGRIYVKFCNMKRYRRGKPMMKRKRGESMDYDDESGGGGGGGGGSAGDSYPTAGDGGNMLAEPNVAIECADDDDDDNEDVVDYGQSFEDWHAQQSPGRPHVKTETLSDGDF